MIANLDFAFGKLNHSVSQDQHQLHSDEPSPVTKTGDRTSLEHKGSIAAPQTLVEPVALLILRREIHTS